MTFSDWFREEVQPDALLAYIDALAAQARANQRRCDVRVALDRYLGTERPVVVVVVGWQGRN